MEQSVVIRYVSGTKSSAVESFPVDGRPELIVGRAPTCDIRYDIAGDDLVSRRHMKIEISGSPASLFTAVDLGSRNGTFINKKRLKNPTRLNVGDVVQLGSGGPEFIFDLDPREAGQEPPFAAVTAYNVLSDLKGSQGEPSPPLPYDRPVVVARPQEAVDRQRASVDIPTPPAAPGPKIRHSSRRISKGLVSAAALVVLASGMLTFYFYRPDTFRLPDGWKDQTIRAAHQVSAASHGAVRHIQTYIAGSAKRYAAWRVKPAAQVAASVPVLPEPDKPEAPAHFTATADSVAHIETGWVLFDAKSGRQLRQVYLENAASGDGDSAGAPLVPNAGRSLPLFVLTDDKSLQPVLTIADNASYRTIGGHYKNSGFVASGGGAVLTSRRVAAPWTVPYEWPADASAGFVVRFDKKLKPVSTAVLARRQFPRWKPVESQFILTEALDSPSTRLATKEVRVDGRTDYLTVSFGNPAHRLAAQVLRSSEHSDLAALRVDTGVMNGLHLRDGVDCAPGDIASIPEASEAGAAWTGRVVASSRDAQDRCELSGDQMTSTQPGSPIFDAHGQVFAIEAASDPLRPDRILAVPIRYGLELIRR